MMGAPVVADFVEQAAVLYRMREMILCVNLSPYHANAWRIFIWDAGRHAIAPHAGRAQRSFAM